MARIFITGSADGLGQLAACALITQGHQVVLHARNEKRAQEALESAPGAEVALVADLSSMKETKKLAVEINGMGRFDAIIHNAGVYNVPGSTLSVDGLPLVLAINTLAPYILTSLVQAPGRLIYLSSGMHQGGDPSLAGLQGSHHRINYSDSKLHDLILSKAVARKWTGVISNAVDPGWVPTKMGGRGAPDNLEKGFQTQVWLAVSNDTDARISGRYLHHQRKAKYLADADNVNIQEEFLALCGKITGVPFPSEPH